jgi:hypothetical protein
MTLSVTPSVDGALKLFTAVIYKSDKGARLFVPDRQTKVENF